MLEDSRVTQLLDDVLGSAVDKRASDVHLEPRDRRLRIRFRIDGVLVEQQPVPKALSAAVIGRAKVLANLDVAEKRVPQDGGFSHQTASGNARFRASTLPTDQGEKIVLRLLSQRGVHLELGRLGMGQQMVEVIRRILQEPSGVILVTGPTGSGKTSTLYSMLRELDDKRHNIVTLEDPIEIRFADIVQTQISVKAGYTFPLGLRAILRQDPDVVLVGEMRDRETADTALKAGLTGHLVLSSVHTNSGVETFIRLIDMGIERFVVSTSLRAVVTQRLIRRLCTHCRQLTRTNEEMRNALGLQGRDHPVYEALGCDKCNDTGFLGRTALFELIEVDEAIEDLIKAPHFSRNAYRELLATRQILTLRESGFVQVLAGNTTFREVMRVT
jgi:general secretion pathway protein E